MFAFDKIVHALSMLIIAFVLGGAAIHKILSQDDFIRSLSSETLLTESSTTFLLFFIAYLEMLVAICLIFIRSMRKSAIKIAAILSLTFLFYRIFALYNQTDSPCGCMPFAEDIDNTHLLLFNILLCALAFTVYFREKTWTDQQLDPKVQTQNQ